MHEQKDKIVELEGLRGLAALLVIFYHIPAWNPALYDWSLIRHGYLAVDFFFVLSGFIIIRTYLGRLNTLQDALKFQWLRVGRLYPVHLLFLVVFLGFELAKWLAVRWGGLELTPPPFSQNDLPAFVRQLFLAHSLGPTGDDATYNYPAWSISVEFYVYVLFAGLLLFFRRLAFYALAGVAMLALLLLLTGIAPGYSNLLRGVAGFFIGTLLFFLVASGLRQVLAASAVLFAGGLALFFFQEPEAGVYFLSGVLILNLLQWPAVARYLRGGSLSWLGARSYSLYMSHAAVVWVFNQALKLGLGRPEVVIGTTSAPQLTLAEAALVYGFLIAACFITAELTYRLVEAPCRSWSRHLVQIRHPACPTLFVS